MPNPRQPDLDIVVPVHNEPAALEASVRMLHGHLSRGFPFSWQITIVEGASTDGTLRVARRLMYELPEVSAMHLRTAGTLRALRAASAATRAAVVVHMKADLSADPSRLLPLVMPIMSGDRDVAIGDAECGFTAMRADLAREPSLLAS